MDSNILYTQEGVVVISYTTLVSSPLSLKDSIEHAFGSGSRSLGIIIVRDLPPVYITYRERLLKLAYHFANLDESTRDKHVHAESRYSFGWSHGKEIMNGKPDTLKASFYANPVFDNPTVTFDEQRAFPEYYGSNIWPNKTEPGVEGFEEAFKDLGSFVFKVGCELAVACQPFVEEVSDLSDKISLPHLIRTSQTTKARLLHYFPPPPSTSLPRDEPLDSWCGFHLDHSLLTGLCSAMYLEANDGAEPTVVPSPSVASGLYIRNRGGDLIKVSIPSDCLAFQTGEALEIATGGKLLATPHCVRVGGLHAERVSRETFALFMQPNTDQPLSTSITFGEFSKRVFNDHYGSRLM